MEEAQQEPRKPCDLALCRTQCCRISSSPIRILEEMSHSLLSPVCLKRLGSVWTHAWQSIITCSTALDACLAIHHHILYGIARTELFFRQKHFKLGSFHSFFFICGFLISKRPSRRAFGKCGNLPRDPVTNGVTVSPGGGHFYGDSWRESG